MLTFACVLLFQTLALGVASPYYEGALRVIPSARIPYHQAEQPSCHDVYNPDSGLYSKQCGPYPLKFTEGFPVMSERMTTYQPWQPQYPLETPVMSERMTTYQPWQPQYPLETPVMSERMTTYQPWQPQYPVETPVNYPNLPHPSKFIGRNVELPDMDEKMTVLSPPRQTHFGVNQLEYPMIFSGIPFGMYPTKFARSEWHPVMGERMTPYNQPFQVPLETPMNLPRSLQFEPYPLNFDRDDELIGYDQPRQTAFKPVPSKMPIVPATPVASESAVPVENPTNLLNTLATRLTKVVSNKFDLPNQGRIDSTYGQDEYPYPSDITPDDDASQARYSEAHRGSYGHHGHFGHHSGGFGHHGGSHHYSSHHSYGHGGHHGGHHHYKSVDSAEDMMPAADIQRSMPSDNRHGYGGHHGGHNHYKSADSAEDMMPVADIQRSMPSDNSYPQSFLPQQNFMPFMSDAMGFRQIPEMESSITEDTDFDSDGPKRVSYHVKIPVEDNVLDPKLKLFPIYNIRCRLEPAKPSPADIPSDDPAAPSLPAPPTPGNAPPPPPPPPPAPISVPESEQEPPPPPAPKPVPAPAPILVPAPVAPPAPAPAPAPEAAEQAPRMYFKREAESKRKVSTNEFLDRLSAINAKLKQIKD